MFELGGWLISFEVGAAHVLNDIVSVSNEIIAGRGQVFHENHLGGSDLAGPGIENALLGTVVTWVRDHAVRIFRSG